MVGAGHEEAGGPSTDSGRPGGRSIRVLVRGGATRTFGDGQRLFSCRQRSFVFAVRAFHSRRGGCVRSSSEFTKSARTRRAVAVLAVVVAAIVAASSAGLYSELLAKLCEHTSEGGRDDRGVLYHMRNRHRSHIVAAVSSACLIARAAASGYSSRSLQICPLLDRRPRLPPEYLHAVSSCRKGPKPCMKGKNSEPRIGRRQRGMGGRETGDDGTL